MEFGAEIARGAFDPADCGVISFLWRFDGVCHPNFGFTAAQMDRSRSRDWFSRIDINVSHVYESKVAHSMPTAVCHANRGGTEV